MARPERSRRLLTRLLVGADGIHSVVRRLHLAHAGREDPLHYLGMLVVLGCVCVSVRARTAMRSLYGASLLTRLRRMTPCDHPICCRTTFQMLDGTTRLFTMPYVSQSCAPVCVRASHSYERSFTSADHGHPNVTFWQLSFPVPLERAVYLKQNLATLREEIWSRCGHWHEPGGRFVCVRRSCVVALSVSPCQCRVCCATQPTR